MTERERFIKALRREPLEGHCPTFELVFFLTLEAIGKIHVSQQSFGQWDQMSAKDFGVEIKKTQPEEKKTDLRADRQDRSIGVEVGDICPICLEGIVEEIGGCNTCTNCNAQLKCGL